ncbi:hypothetical protein AWR27_05270 [Spirosoma montaniterrae]|uniref:Glycosyltransferase RgtA/B/C/D-like domain-containing protein n=2 Tax=Spirosoma montaniterrae TaxID=1178516 RepID=A0A1P9X413_9BACT|nr:hypothetical protein AWR27_05270 [Spirosoma montaniterrae]
MGSWIVGDFSRPLSDGNDTDQYEYVGYYFAKNLSLWPFPQLNLLNNQSFYPYGLNQALLPWGFERDYWYATAYRLFDGPGPYLQYYYVLSLVVSALGTYWLLQKRFGWLKATVAGLIVSVFNFYALYKFPVHLNVCVAHWTVLCIVATYCLLHDILNKRPVSLPFVLGWMLLHVLSLGLELGYVAGFALTFTTLAIPVLGWSLYQQYPVVQQWPALLMNYGRRQWQHRAWFIGGLITLLLIGIWLYVPLTLQIALTAWQFDFAATPTAPLWSHPARLFIPYLLGFDTLGLPYQQWLRDSFESFGQGSPGLYLTLLAGLGLWQTRHRVALWLPVVLMLLLCLLYHPVLLPTLKVFPWFSFNRHGGRASLVYPVLLVLLALPLRLPRHRPGLLALGLVILLMLSEWRHGFLLRTYLPTLIVSDDVLRYCAVVRQQPGEAVLDFPFCAVGADGTGMAEGLCPHYDAQNAVFTFRRFYDKKAVGQYFGRLHPDQIQPFLRDGWPRLLKPGYVFTKPDWQFLDQFLRTNNFAGINLYPDLLSPAQVAQFYRRYGPPIAQTHFPAAGRVVFLPLKNLPKT